MRKVVQLSESNWEGKVSRWRTEAKKKKAREFYGDSYWLPRRDSNPNKQNQNLRCYHYTTRQTRHVLFVMAGSTGLEPATPG